MRAVVFDLDGTLVDSLPDLTASLGELLRASGRERLRPQAVRAMIGDGARKLVERAFEATGGVPDDLDARLERFLAIYQARATEHTRPYAGVVPALAALREAGFHLGVCTNKPIAHTREILDGTDLSRWFTGVVGGDELPFRKPDPRHLLEVLSRMRVGAASVVMVGDGPTDIEAGAAAGCATVAVAWGYCRVPVASLGADAVIARPDELVAAIRGVMPQSGQRS